jgi:hypothetical protein
MPTWWIGPDYATWVNKGYQLYETDDIGREAITKRLQRKPGRWEKYEVKELSELFIDGGGAVSMGESKVRCTIETGTYATWLRHLPFALEALKDLSVHEPESLHLPCVAMSGFHRLYIFSVETRDLLVAEFERLLAGTEELMKEQERKHAELLNSNKTFYAGKCSCQSGKPYNECCGLERKLNEKS